ncbi:MAG: hypothetical protein ACK47B_20610 [Armatimonadota bacterium]
MPVRGGISRSAGIAAALAEWLGEASDPIFRYYRPNRLVYERLLAAARRFAAEGSGDVPAEPGAAGAAGTDKP